MKIRGQTISQEERVTLENSKEVLWVHRKKECKGQACPIHRRSKHHMRKWPQHWRPSLMERICPHGIGHPDPDDLMADSWSTRHSCDGCCSVDIDITYKINHPHYLSVSKSTYPMLGAKKNGI